MDKDNDSKRDGYMRNNQPQRRRPISEVYDDDSFESYNLSEEGVIYTPSEPQKAAHKKQQRPQTQPKPKKSAPAKKRTAAKKRNTQSLQWLMGGKNQYAMFYIITLVAAVLICVAVFFMVFNSVTGNGGSGAQGSGGNGNPAVVAPSDEPTESAMPLTNLTSIVGVIHSINAGNRTVEVYDIDNYTSYTFTIDTATTLRDKYGELRAFNDFSVGDIVDARYSDDNNLLASLTESGKAWEQRNVTNLRVNTDSQTVVLGNSTYAYNDKVKVVYKGATYDLSALDQTHTVTMRGMDNVVWYIEIAKGVGIIEIINGKDIKDGTIEIGSSTTIFVDEGELALESNLVKVAEGNYHIVIKGSNIETITRSLDVMADQTVTLNLDDVQVIAGVLSIAVNVADANITIDGKQIKPNEPQVLSYGEHVVKAEKEGYESYEETFEISEANTELVISLKETVQLTNIEIITNPTGADIYIDNAYIGVSPLTTPVNMDTDTVRRLTVKKEGYMDTTTYMLQGQMKYDITMLRDGSASTPVPGDFLNTSEPAVDPFPTIDPSPDTSPQPEESPEPEDDDE